MKDEHPMLRRLFGENVRLARVAARLSQSDVAQLSGLHRTYIGGIERGERNASLDNLERLVCALGYQASELLSADFSPDRRLRTVENGTPMAPVPETDT